MHKLALPLSILLLFCATTVKADATVNWQDTTQTLSKQVLQNSNITSDLTDLIDEHFQSTPALDTGNLKITINNARRPAVNAESTEIILPYSYIIASIKAHSELEETKEQALQRGLDMVEYTLYHLFAHLLLREDSEDADDLAEAWSSWLMIKSFPNGAEQWFADSTAFARASQLLDGSVQDYWHAHSLSKSTQRKINCWILGSDTVKYQRLLKPVLDPEERNKRCAIEWQQLDRAARDQLEPYLKPESKLLR